MTCNTTADTAYVIPPLTLTSSPRVSFVGASFSTHIWHLLLSQGLCFGLGLGFCFTSTVGVVPQWFTKKRSFANSVATSGSGFGGLTYSLATNAMISNLGLAWAFRILAIIAFVVNGACSLIVRDRNKAVGAVHIPFHKDLFKKSEFWLFLGWGFFSILSYVIVVFSITDYALSVGFSASQGSLAAAMFNRKPPHGPLLLLFLILIDPAHESSVPRTWATPDRAR